MTPARQQILREQCARSQEAKQAAAKATATAARESEILCALLVLYDARFADATSGVVFDPAAATVMESCGPSPSPTDEDR